MEPITFEGTRPLVQVLNDYWARNLKTLCELIGMSPNKRAYLCNCLNPAAQETNRLPLITAIQTLDVSPEAMRFEFCRLMLRRWGLVPVALPQVEGQTNAGLYQDLAQATREVGAVAQVLLEVLEDKRITQGEFERLDKEVTEAVSKLLALLADAQTSPLRS